MLTHRRRSQPWYANSSNIVEVDSPETASQIQTKPDQVPLPLSRSPSPDIECENIDKVKAPSVDVQKPSDSGQDRDQSTQGRADSPNETRKHKEAVSADSLVVRFLLVTDVGKHAQNMPQNAPPNKKSLNGVDPFAEGEKKLAEFWPMYVKEADSFDRELSEGWNKFSNRSLETNVFCAYRSRILVHSMLEVILSE